MSVAMGFFFLQRHPYRHTSNYVKLLLEKDNLGQMLQQRSETLYNDRGCWNYM